MPAPLITIFNGRQIDIGEGSTKRVYMQVDVNLRKFLHQLKGAKLAVFFDVAFHSNSRGWSWISRKGIARETGYNEDTVSKALTQLCEMTIEGDRLLLRHQTAKLDGTFGPNHYLIFPTPADLAQYESTQPQLIPTDVQPCSGLPCTVEPGTVEPCTVEPCTVGPCTENHYTNYNHGSNDNHGQLEPEGEQKPEEEEEPAASQPAAAPIFCSIHHVQMTLRQKDGDEWYSHKTPAGIWCKGAPGDQPNPVDPHITDRSRYLEWDTRRYIEGEFAEFIQH